MSEAQTNPQGEVNTPQLNMFDVMFGSDENTNPEQAIETPRTRYSRKLNWFHSYRKKPKKRKKQWKSLKLRMKTSPMVK